MSTFVVIIVMSSFLPCVRSMHMQIVCVFYALWMIIYFNISVHFLKLLLSLRKFRVS